MKLLVQWATDPISDWEQHDHREWHTLPIKSEPIGGEVLDSRPGWIHQLCVQGNSFSGDHIAVLALSNSLMVYCWNDDPEEYTEDEIYGCIYQFVPFTDKPSTKAFLFKGKELRLTIPSLQGIYIRHGVWMPDAMIAAYNLATRRPTWAEWIGDKL